MKNKKGFTLVELIAVIVILGILVVIAVPTVSSYIESSKKQAYLDTVNGVVNTVKYGVMMGKDNYSMDGLDTKTFNLNDIKTENGKITDLNGYVKVVRNGEGYDYYVKLTGSTVDNRNYCTNSEINVTNLKTNSFSRCSSSSSSNSSNSSTPTTSYTAYSIGTPITYKGSSWYVIKNSTTSEDYVTLLKANVLTRSEVGSGYANANASDSYAAYYWSSTCHYNSTYGSDVYSSSDTSGCSGHNDYAGSKIKEVVDNYMNNYLDSSELKTVENYKIRLMKKEELIALGWTSLDKAADDSANSVPSWAYSTGYWTMSPDTSDSSKVLIVNSLKYLYPYDICTNMAGSFNVRPVINLLKSAISS